MTRRPLDTFSKVWTDIDQEIRTHPYFKTFAVNTGLLEYWKAHGRPERCRALEGGDFKCR